MMKFRLLLALLILTCLIQSCDDDDEMMNEVTVSITDFNTTIDENPSAGLSLGTVNATTSQGNITFSITEQTPDQAIAIDATTGELTVLTESLFDFETNPTITGVVRAENTGVSETANITINLNDINEAVDDFQLLAVSDLGEVFEIGNNTGNIAESGQISKEKSGTALLTNTLVASEDKIYAIEYFNDPAPTSNLLIYDRENGTTEIIPLAIPATITGNEIATIAMTLDDGNLIGIVTENFLVDNSTKHLINIDLQDNSVTELGITFNERSVSSMIKMDSKLYISTWEEGFLEVDLVGNTVDNVTTINGSRLAQVNDTELGIMQSVPGNINGAKPGVLDLNTQTVTDKSNGEIYGLVTVFGNTIYEGGIYLNLVSSNSMNLFLGILKTNVETDENTIVEINSTTVNRNLIIVDTNN
ncbi:MAG: cadherin repeat domain-containing protein [Bacteroidota bacterium]